MSEKRSLSADYVNAIMSGLLKEFYMQRAGGARFRVVRIGQDFFADKSGEAVVPGDLEGTLEKLKEVLPRLGIVSSVDVEVTEKNIEEYDLQGYLVTLKLKDCAHLPMEKRLKEQNITPYLCPSANIACGVLEEALKDSGVKDTELVTIECGEDSCEIKFVVTQGHRRAQQNRSKHDHQ